jgi:hypothetical protein
MNSALSLVFIALYPFYWLKHSAFFFFFKSSAIPSRTTKNFFIDLIIIQWRIKRDKEVKK